jgi:hypothetical protein
MKKRIAALLVIAMASCTDSDVPTGSVDLAVTGTGTDGNSYRLPAGTSMVFINPTFQGFYSLDGDGPVSIDIPVGEYQASLFHQDGHTSQWPLTRVRDGNTEVVVGTLTAIVPNPVLVETSLTTRVALTFTVADGGTVIFEHGTVEVVLDVDQTEATGGQNLWDGTLTTDEAAVSPACPAEIANDFPLAGDGGLHVQMDVTLSGAWQQRGVLMACAPVIVGMSSGASGPAGFADLVWESIGPQSELCVTTNDDVSEVFLRLQRHGSATTSTFAGRSDDYYFATSLRLPTADLVFDGQVLDLSLISGSRTAPFLADTFVYSNGVQWYYGIHSGTVSFTFAPQ